MKGNSSRGIILAFIIGVPLHGAAAQTYLGDFSGYSAAGNSLTVRAESSSVRLTFYSTDIVRTDYLPFPTSIPDSSFAVIRDTSHVGGIAVEETDSTLSFISPVLRVLCRKYPLRFSFFDGAGTLMLEEPASGGLSTAGSSRTAHFTLNPTTHFYGTGERGIGVDLRGRAFDSYNTQVYGYGSALSAMNINIPFLATTDGCALYFDNTYPGRFDLGSLDPNTFSYLAGGGELTYYVIAAPDVREQLDRYTWLTGRQPLPPRWAFGYIQSKFGYRNEAEARAMVQTMRQKHIPCDAIILDLYWFDKMGDLSWSPTNFPNPSQMISDFLADGFKTIAITEPYIVSTSGSWSAASGSGYLTTDSSGQSYLMPDWWSCNCPASLLDMTKPAARSWWWSKHPSFFGNGLAGIWTDLGEPERHPDDMIHFLGSTARIHNIYDLLWAQSVFEGFNQFRPDRRLFNLTRSGFAGIQRYGVIPWSGDVRKSFGGLAAQLPMLLNMGMSGLAYHNSDIGGFCCGFTNDELYVRWMQFGSFCPITRAHGAGPAVGGQDTEPWAFGATAEAIATAYIRLRYQLLPYTYTLAHENYTSGIPLARPVFFEYPGVNTFNESASYMWGDAVLVSPVVQAGQTSKSIFLPPGTWFDYWSDQQYQGGRSVSVSAPLETMPLFVRAGSMIPMQSVMNYSNERPLDTLFLAIYPSSDQPATFTLYEDDGYTLRYQSGEYAQTLLEQYLIPSDSGVSIHVVIGASSGDYEGKPSKRVFLSEIHGIAVSPSSVRSNGIQVPERRSYEELRRNGDGFFYEQGGQRLYIHTPTHPDSAYELVADNLHLVRVEEAITLPGEFLLEQNYPNPFNPKTNFRFRLPAGQAVISHARGSSQETDAGGNRRFVSLKIFDVLGREVATLVHEAKEPGEYTVSWDAGGAAGGIYFCRMRVGTFTQTRKLVLLK